MHFVSNIVRFLIKHVREETSTRY